MPKLVDTRKRNILPILMEETKIVFSVEEGKGVRVGSIRGTGKGKEGQGLITTTLKFMSLGFDPKEKTCR